MKLKRTISAVTAAAIISAAALPVFAYQFSDIEDDAYSWAADMIDEMYDAGYITGYEDGTFRPDNEVTRLECLALFSRAMGATDEANEDLLTIAHDDYDSLISNYSLTWGTDEIAYLLYKGVLKKTDLDTYLLGTEKNELMKRYEAAIIITKALGGETEALVNSSVDLDYTDVKSIPSAALQYVSYASDAGIMNGMEDGSFSPNSSVSRAQMAVMLSRTVDATQYEFLSAKLTDVDAEYKTVTYIVDGDEDTVSYTDDASMRILGTLTQAANMITNVQAVISLSNNEVVSVDTLSDTPDETVSGTFKSYSTSAGTVYIGILNSETEELESYPCSSDISVTYAGSPATLKSFATGDSIELSLSDGIVTLAVGNEQEVQIKNATVTSLNIGTEDVTITISSAESEYDGKTYTVDGSVTVRKNSVDSDLTNIYEGDTVTLTLQYNIVKKIVATSTTKTVSGTIESITIESPRSSMVVNVNGTSTSYTIPEDVEITVNDEEGSLYDFRVGDTVKVTTESNAITKISATTTQTTSGSITGVVTGVNTSYGFISIQDDDGTVTQVFCKDSTTTFIMASGTSKKLSSIESGQTVTVRGTITNGAFVATLVIIE